jgi:hypothetical protein
MDLAAVQEILRAVRHDPEVRSETPGLKPFALVPSGFEVKSLDALRTTLDLDRIEQRVTLLTADAFVDYFGRFADDDSVIFADETKGTGEPLCPRVNPLESAWAPAWRAASQLSSSRTPRSSSAANYCHRSGRVTDTAIRREIDRCRRWAKLLKGGKAR